MVTVEEYNEERGRWIARDEGGRVVRAREGNLRPLGEPSAENVEGQGEQQSPPVDLTTSEEGLQQQLAEMGLMEHDVWVLDDMVGDCIGKTLEQTGISEVFSVPRVSRAGAMQGLTQGWSLDLLTGWNFSLRSARQAARRLLQVKKPRLLVGSPACTIFSTLINLSKERMDPQVFEQRWKEAVLHFAFVVELYKEQHQAGRLFLHEHPQGASSWGLESITGLLRTPGVLCADADQCMLRLVSYSKSGEAIPAR